MKEYEHSLPMIGRTKTHVSRPPTQEPFDDAPEVPNSTNNLSLSIPQNSSTRSLTESPQGGTSATTPSTEPPPVPPVPQNEKHDEETDEFSEDRQSDAEETPRKKKSQKSPLLTAHRLSTTSLDEVNLAGNKEDESVDQLNSAQDRKPSPPPLPTRDSPPPQDSHAQGLSGSLPSVPWGPPPVNKNNTAPAPPPQQPRKLPGPFSWLTRSSTSGVKSPPSESSRRNTRASASTVSSNAGAHDGDDAEGSSVGSKKPKRSSLKDQFKLLRMREEGQVPENDESSAASGHASASQSNGSPPSIPEEGEDGVPPTPALSGGATSTVNSKLPPGTVSGISTSATDASAPVDWELWQQIVNYGPQALTGANSDELNAAIKRGIPQTIRGVIWQVLADSRNAELEEAYRDLVVRGTDKEVDRQRFSTGQVNGNGEKESATSSRSSIKSEQSAAPSNAGTVSPHEPETEKQAKEQAAAENARQKKAKEDTVALQKLEKSIRRDLGARTSYSRYFVSQGNQDSLFGLCKAYALYDEGVGYAQGMNFIAMPLLFNVSDSVRQERKALLIHLLDGRDRSVFAPCETDEPLWAAGNVYP